MEPWILVSLCVLPLETLGCLTWLWLELRKTEKELKEAWEENSEHYKRWMAAEKAKAMLRFELHKAKVELRKAKGGG